MKRILVLALMLLSFVLASCEEEEHERHYGYYDGRPGAAYPDGRYPDGRYPDGYYPRGYRLLDETVRNDGVLQVESTVEP